MYASNSLKIKKYNASKCQLLKELSTIVIEVGYREDVVVNGLGFIKIVDKASVLVYVDKNVDVFTRKSLI